MSSSSTSLAVHAAALICFYSGYGLLQERIMKGTYGPEEAHFTSSSLLVMLNRLFAMVVAVSLMVYRCSRPSSTMTFVQRLKPRSPLYAYAAVAACNFLSTSCQYEALRYVSFTTQSLAKCAKMVPVLLVGALVYSKTHKPKQWVSAGVVTLGCAVYLFSNPPASKHARVDDDASSASMMDGLFGGALLLGYLFFDGLTSTTQERVFGKSPSSTDPFGPQSPVLDQMVYVNACAVFVSSLVALLSSVGGGLAPNLWLLLNSRPLMTDVLMLSATAALGLIVLLNCIASFGALTSSTIMTCRQFLSILINAGAFGNFASIGAQGWLGVAWVGAGVFIKMDPRYREPTKSSNSDNVNKAEYVPLSTSNPEEKQAVFDYDQEEGTRQDCGDEAQDSLLPRSTVPVPEHRISSKVTKTRMIKQYGIPIIMPLAVALCLIPFSSHKMSRSQLSSELNKWSSYIPYVGTTTNHVPPHDDSLNVDQDFNLKPILEADLITTEPVTEENDEVEEKLSEEEVEDTKKEEEMEQSFDENEPDFKAAEALQPTVTTSKTSELFDVDEPVGEEVSFELTTELEEEQVEAEAEEDEVGSSTLDETNSKLDEQQMNRRRSIINRGRHWNRKNHESNKSLKLNRQRNNI